MDDESVPDDGDEVGEGAAGVRPGQDDPGRQDAADAGVVEPVVFFVFESDFDSDLDSDFDSDLDSDFDSDLDSPLVSLLDDSDDDDSDDDSTGDA